jgi:hypothetical protein
MRKKEMESVLRNLWIFGMPRTEASQVEGSLES